MARIRKVYIRHQTYFITFRAEAGIPFPATALMTRILEGILCKAQSMYPVEVVCHKFMGNHVHMVITVNDPELVDNFIQYVKRESAHAVNRLIGRRKRTIWCAGYDSPLILDLEKLFNIITYIYTNAAESGLSDTINEYPGLSSWKMFLDGEYELRKKRLKRDELPLIGIKNISLSRQHELVKELEDKGLEENTFVLSPYAFMKSFKTDLSESEIKSEIISRVEQRELEIRNQRTKPVYRKEKLMSAAINLDYVPEKFGKKMICHGTDKGIRAAYINWFKNLCEKAAAIYRDSKNKIAEMILPPGIFSPGGYLTANILFFEV